MARRIGTISAVAAFILSASYAVVLAAGLLSLDEPGQPIGDPWFTLLELLILALAPTMVVLMAAVHVRAREARRVLSLCALVFIGIVAALTSAVHMAILVLGRSPQIAEAPWSSVLLSFRWPSLVYVLDVLAWDLFFALAMLFAAFTFEGGGPPRAIRSGMIASGLLSLAGLAGVARGDMDLRNVGILGYAIVFPVVALLLAILFAREDHEARV
ncbi:hypothetical protein B2G71_03565 [Novosphingobium sp. PC22D]|nr:hypothetical protein B2G71_03565 [Novosphingobium sp. PC22D]